MNPTDRVKVKGKQYRPLVGIVRMKSEDGRPLLVEFIRDDEVIDLKRESAREFVVMFGSVDVFK